MSILEHFPGEPREVQIRTLELIEKNWQDHDVFVLNLPVAAGKSYTSVAIARWAQKLSKWKTSIITPNNLLVKQYKDAFPRMHSISKKASYLCEDSAYKGQPVPIRCEQVKAGKKKRYCPSCPYVRDLKQMRVMPYGVYNYYTYLAHRIFRDVVVVDEAHKLVSTIKELSAKTLWWHEYKYPHWVTTYSKLARWVEEHPKRDEDRKLSLLWKDLQRAEPNFVVKRILKEWRGEERECLEVLPVDISQEHNPFFPSGVKKIILMSGTISKFDVEQLGLAKKRIAYIDAESPIPAEQRPIIFGPEPVNCSFAYQTKNIAHVARLLEELAMRHEGRGLVHLPYGLAPRLRGLLENKRFLSHSKEDKKLKFEQFLQSEDRILLASGFYEGIDLPYDVARWQVIVKVPWPSLAEPAIKALSERDGDRYAWEAIKDLVQASGRICRAPDDYGVTYILDSTFENLYASYHHLFPHYFVEACEEGHNVEFSETTKSGRKGRAATS